MWIFGWKWVVNYRENWVDSFDGQFGGQFQSVLGTIIGAIWWTISRSIWRTISRSILGDIFNDNFGDNFLGRYWRRFRDNFGDFLSPNLFIFSAVVVEEEEKEVFLTLEYWQTFNNKKRKERTFLDTAPKVKASFLHSSFIAQFLDRTRLKILFSLHGCVRAF